MYISLSTLALILLAIWFIDTWQWACLIVARNTASAREHEAAWQRTDAIAAEAEARRLAPLRNLPGWHPDAGAWLLRQSLPLATLVPEGVWWHVEEAADGQVVDS